MAAKAAYMPAAQSATAMPARTGPWPGRPVTDIRPETVIALANAFPKVFVGLKDASGDLTRATEHRRGIAGAFDQLCGDDPVWLQHYAAGGAGCISVTANVAPRLCADLQAALEAGDFATARAIDARLYPLHRAMFSDASPAPVKYALSRIHDWLDDSVRLPLIAAAAGILALLAMGYDFGSQPSHSEKYGTVTQTEAEDGVMPSLAPDAGIDTSETSETSSSTP